MQGHFFPFSSKIVILHNRLTKTCSHSWSDSHSASFKSEDDQPILLLFCDAGAPFLLFKISSPKVGMVEGQATYLSNSVNISNLCSMLVFFFLRHGLYWYDMDGLIEKGKKEGKKGEERRKERGQACLTLLFSPGVSWFTSSTDKAYQY